MPPNSKRKFKQPVLHKWADKCTEILIYFLVLFSPWAFGTTEHWSIWTMNITAYALGVLLLSKWITRWSTGFRPWQSEASKNEISPSQHRLRLIHKTCTICTAVLMFLLLGYILTSAINARASFNLETHEYTYFEGINKNLPHSYDANGTWFLFWQYLGLIILFWSTRDWLAGARPTRSAISLNPRLKRLLFMICLNGGVLVLECIIQRIYYEDTLGKLLFFIEPRINNINSAQFGPFAYRSNAASYFNLIWPLGLGLFLQMGRVNLDYAKRRIGSSPEFLLIPFIVITAAGSAISSSRAGAFVMLGLLILAIVLLLFLRVRSKFHRISFLTSLFTGLAILQYLGWETLENRLINGMQTMGNNSRTKIFETAFKMIDEYPIFGSGPGSFEALAQFELNENFTKWHSWVHCDYLEFYLTFGIPGGAIAILVFAVLNLQQIVIFLRSDDRILRWFALLAMLGLFTHATIDFPLQVHSVTILLTLIGAALTYNSTRTLESHQY